MYITIPAGLGGWAYVYVGHKVVGGTEVYSCTVHGMFHAGIEDYDWVWPLSHSETDLDVAMLAVFHSI